MDLSAWEEPDPGSVHNPANDAEWDQVVAKYLDSRNDTPLRRCVQVARSNGAKALVVETRYLDLDYRSEYSTYFSRLFATVPDSTHRLHFFARNLTPDQLWNLPSNHGYLGYVVIRPTPNGPVSRAMLAPPPDIADAIRAKVTERITFFGQRLEVTGVPFAQQDTQLGACAHAAAWMCYQSAQLRGEAARRPRADFSLLANASLQPARVTPTQGLTALQLSDLYRVLGLPAIYYALGELPQARLPWQPPPPTPVPGTPAGKWDHGVIPVICRYLNSGLPVLVGTHDHAFVVCGYRRDPKRLGWIEFFRNDDQRGPYLSIGDVLNDVDPIWNYTHTPWRTLHVPVPEKIWLLPEAAERVGGQILQVLSRPTSQFATTLYGARVESLDDLIAGGHLALKTYVQSANDFKQALPSRNMPDEIVKAYRLARFSRYLWVVEAVDRRLRSAGRPCVVGHAIFDATSDDLAPNRLAMDVHGVAWVSRTDRSIDGPTFGITGPYESGAVGPP